jgi:hypothetical protein
MDLQGQPKSLSILGALGFLDYSLQEVLNGSIVFRSRGSQLIEKLVLQFIEGHYVWNRSAC